MAGRAENVVALAGVAWRQHTCVINTSQVDKDVARTCRIIEPRGKVRHTLVGRYGSLDLERKNDRSFDEPTSAIA